MSNSFFLTFEVRLQLYEFYSKFQMAAAVLHCNSNSVNCGTAYYVGDLRRFFCW